MMIRFVCTTHNTPLKNCGNGRVFFPTACLEPITRKDGWMQLDLSEYYCPVAHTADDNKPLDAATFEYETCNFVIQTQEGHEISDETELTDKGWKFKGEQA